MTTYNGKSYMEQVIDAAPLPNYRGASPRDEAMKCRIETTDVDVEATAWAIATLEALHVDCMSTDNAAMMDRLRKMTGA